ncbi:MAG: primosomal protein N' [Clostridia bacterium]|nr:primosomal protein N' [Clostridia bacterium]
MVAEVIVDISNSEVDKVFDYLIDGSPEIRAGFRVLVPFGKTTVEGYVIKVKECSDYPLEKLKPIHSVLDEYPVISTEMMTLMEYMRERYHLRTVDVLRLFIPSQMRGGRVKELTVKYAYLSPEYRDKDVAQFIRASASAQMDLVCHLQEVDRESVTALNRDFSAAALRNLIARGIVLTEEEESLRTPYKKIEGGENKKITLTPAQQKVVDRLKSDEHEVYLLHGVTGSGKTEVYMHSISAVLERGKSAIMLVPEISLTPQVLRVFRSRFGDNVALLHSGLSAGERFDEWRRLLQGKAKVAIGARSAIFAPLTNLGLIIIDEEHDSSYISETNPRYVTHEVACFRAKYNDCSLVMGSATPSIDSYYYATTGKYKLLELPERVNKRALPEISVVNMCNEVYDGNNGLFSRLLLARLTECMDRNEQAIIFLNRRGYSSYMMCRTCGYVAKCEQCDVSLVYHKEENVLKCHYCGNRYAVLDECPECHSNNIKRGYVGTQQIVEQLSALFPDKKILRMDNDTTQNKDSHAKILGEFAAKKASILVGTQMIAKGHDFPDVTLVGIVDADMSLHFSDFRSNERTFQLITQVAGRAGRDEKLGKVVLQTYSPNHYVYNFAVKNNYKGFYEKEANLREVSKYPPFSRIVRVLVSSESEELASRTLKGIFDEVTEISRQKRENFAYFGAMKSPVKRIQSKFRVQILMRLIGENDEIDDITKEVYCVVDKYTIPKASVFVEINPNNLS